MGQPDQVADDNSPRSVSPKREINAPLEEPESQQLLKGSQLWLVFRYVSLQTFFAFSPENT